MANGSAVAAANAEPTAASRAAASIQEPEWLTLFCARADASAVAEAWLNDIAEEARPNTEEDKIIATRGLRSLIVDSDRPEVRKDAESGWRYTGLIMRAADKLLHVAPPKARPAFKAPNGNEGYTAPPAPAARADGQADESLRIPAAEVGKLPATASSPALKRSKAPKLVLEGDGKPGNLVLWWSDFQGAADQEFLKASGITHRLSCAAEVVGKLPEVEGVETVHLPMPDVFDDSPDLHETWVGYLREAHQILLRWRERGAIVNVNCQMGKNRSGAALLVYLCNECGWQLHEGVEQFRSINALACANPHLLMALGEVLGVDGRVALNAADDDGGGWVCISPPGSPRVGAAAPPSFEELAAQASKKLASAVDAPDEEEEEDDEEMDAAPLFSHLDDVD